MSSVLNISIKMTLPRDGRAKREKWCRAAVVVRESPEPGDKRWSREAATISFFQLHDKANTILCLFLPVIPFSVSLSTWYFRFYHNCVGGFTWITIPASVAEQAMLPYLKPYIDNLNNNLHGYLTVTASGLCCSNNNAAGQLQSNRKSA